MDKVKVGIIGCGNISAIYFKNCKLYRGLEVVACADLDVARAQARAEEFGVPKGCSVDELLADPQIDLVINLTIPAAHAEICQRALLAGKHVYVEKPLAVTREDGRKTLELAKEKGLRVGCAPDTFLGGGIQTCIKLIRDGWIGEPLAATAFMMARGPEGWHPDPVFFYKTGGGPMFDMGPYYLTALVAMLGPINRVAGMTKTSFPERRITSEPKYGQMIQVDIPTHIAGMLEFDSGAIGTIITSFDIMGGANLPRIEIYGSAGTLSVPDPNTFGGPIQFRRKGAKEWAPIPLTHGFAENSRSVGALDMALAIAENRPHRASGDLAYHVLEAMHGFHDASNQGSHYEMKSKCASPEPMPMDADSLWL
ncbi:Gfo/Idh/MocA family oxidoreductase [Paenibacillus hemerocallicola]|uniref:Gfo/Idh/MocA family oxidoreductase n=1 Tax=Paenibacillus hemerocallicola TaxID=1172614 RepID=A0A5C4TG21_9BACL|nr:Gfo/Idh/MocA family oxidoreductase [Paenibacillus hemerocallicola]TNJ68033.1 Gfo/Idh/MocA family oxidoreductase [Paenibacillus hemerocallicola]